MNGGIYMEKLFLNFKKRIEEHEGLVEAICLSNKDGVIWKEQYFPRTNRNIYSHSKSFTSLMVGIAIDENKLSLDTRLVDVFKDEINELLETLSNDYEKRSKSRIFGSRIFITVCAMAL